MVDPRQPLRRARSDRMIAGVVGGLARYAGIDPTVFVTRPISLGFMIVTLLILIIMVLPAVRAKRSVITD